MLVSRMPLRAVFGRVLLALLLAVTSQQALRHELLHAFERLEQRSAGDHHQHDVCPTCVAFSGLHDLAGVAHALPALIHAHYGQQADVAFRSVHAGFAAAYLSRAPPSLPF
jgi:hypothetical protein